MLSSHIRALTGERNMNKGLGYALINLGRRAFVGTPIQHLKITNAIYTRIFRAMYAEGIATAEYKGVTLTLPTKDTTIVPSILGGYYESLELDLFAKAAEESRTVLDIGANIGLFSCVAGKAMRTGGSSTHLSLCRKMPRTFDRTCSTTI